jgi:hypothetical protein
MVEGRALPVGDVVRLLDEHLADVVELLGGDEGRDGGDVLHRDGTGDIALGRVEREGRRGRHASLIAASHRARLGFSGGQAVSPLLSGALLWQSQRRLG